MVRKGSGSVKVNAKNVSNAVLTHQVFQSLLSSPIRVEAFEFFHNALTSGFDRSADLSSDATAKLDRRFSLVKAYDEFSGILPEKPSPTFIDAAFALARWSTRRLLSLRDCLLDPIHQEAPPQPLWGYLEILNAAHESLSAYESENIVNPSAYEIVWKKYGVEVLNMDPQNMGIDEGTLQNGAVLYYTELCKDQIASISLEELIQTIYHLTGLGLGYSIFPLFAEQLHLKCGIIRLKHEVIPRLLALTLIQAHLENYRLLEAIICNFKSLVSGDAANLALELSCHLPNGECTSLLVDHFKGLFTAEGICTAFLPLVMMGNTHSLAILELCVMELMDQSNEPDDADPDNASVRSSVFRLSVAASRSKKPRTSVALRSTLASRVPPKEPRAINTSDESIRLKMDAQQLQFISLSTYVMIILSAVGGKAPPSAVSELCAFFEDCCHPNLLETVPAKVHKQLIEEVFMFSCEQNLSGVISAMMEIKWMPASIEKSFMRAVDLGHQNVVHIFLEYYLGAEPKNNPFELPRLFFDGDIFALLPLAAERFPSEASWFLEQISLIPIPAALPRFKTRSAFVPSSPVLGIKFGVMKLSTAITSVRSTTFWSAVSVRSQLRRGSGSDDFEIESTICMVPEGLLTRDARYNLAIGPRYFHANPFIRLLATGDENIILQPVMRALIEYHWVRGYFWIRFVAQFLTTLTHILIVSWFFVLVVQVNLDPSDLGAAQSMFTVSFVVLFGSLFFLGQELREFLDAPQKYMSSISNAIDIGIHMISIIIIIQAVYLGGYVPPLLMAIILVFCATRILLHLRVIPSIGPMIRIWVSATMNVLPILVPMAIIVVSFAAGFYMIQLTLPQIGSAVVSFGSSVQIVLTIGTNDYTVLQNSLNPQVFTLRMLFWFTFVIFLLNIIVALMTVNVVDIHSNLNAAWLMEIADLMVELDLLWPVPIRYSLKPRKALERKVHPVTTISSHGGPTDFYGGMVLSSAQSTYVYLYTWPTSQVSAGRWWHSIDDSKASPESQIVNEEEYDKSNLIQGMGKWTSAIYTQIEMKRMLEESTEKLDFPMKMPSPDEATQSVPSLKKSEEISGVSKGNISSDYSSYSIARSVGDSLTAISKSSRDNAKSGLSLTGGNSNWNNLFRRDRSPSLGASPRQNQDNSNSAQCPDPIGSRSEGVSGSAAAQSINSLTRFRESPPQFKPPAALAEQRLIEPPGESIIPMMSVRSTSRFEAAEATAIGAGKSEPPGSASTLGPPVPFGMKAPTAGEKEACSTVEATQPTTAVRRYWTDGAGLRVSRQTLDDPNKNHDPIGGTGPSLPQISEGLQSFKAEALESITDLKALIRSLCKSIKDQIQEQAADMRATESRIQHEREERNRIMIKVNLEVQRFAKQYQLSTATSSKYSS